MGYFSILMNLITNNTCSTVMHFRCTGTHSLQMSGVHDNISTCYYVYVCIGWGFFYHSTGAQCVLTLLWPLPNRCLGKFYYHLYTELNRFIPVSNALRKVIATMQTDKRSVAGSSLISSTFGS